jgi:four helix bundle protein
VDEPSLRGDRKAVIGLLSPVMSQYKFQKLDVYQLGLAFVDRIYEVANQLPDSERFNLRSQLERAATSIVLNIAEGSTGQSDLEQNRFLGMALRSYIETVACMDLIDRRKYIRSELIGSTRQLGHRVFVKLQAFRGALKK